MAKSKSTEKTEEEIRAEFLGTINNLIDYWDTVDTSTKEKLQGITHSILCILDGASSVFPSFIVAPNPHPDDKAYSISKQIPYFPENEDSNIKGNIAGVLHEEFGVLCSDKK